MHWHLLELRDDANRLSYYFVAAVMNVNNHLTELQKKLFDPQQIIVQMVNHVHVCD